MIFYNIQISRGIAAILVLLSHVNLMVDPELINGFFLIGWSGLHFFFVLSGFIIFYVNSDKFGDRRHFRQYLYKRVRRIYPIYWVYTVGIIVVHLLILWLCGMKLVTWTDISIEGVLMDLALFPKNEMPVIPVAWTLTFEMLFYLVFSLLILLPRIVSAGIVVTWIAVIILEINGAFELRTPLIKVIANPINIEFMLGCIAAFLVKKKAKFFTEVWTRIILIAGGSIFFLAWGNAWSGYSYQKEFDEIQFGIPLFLLVLGMSLHEKRKIENTQSGSLMGIKRIAVYFGDASYSIYLVHYLVIVLMTTAFLKSGFSLPLVEASLITIVAIGLGCLGYNLLERPLLNLIPARIQARQVS